jgi:hypothetical protein
LPLSRFSRQDLVREVVARGLVAHISGATIWRWLDQDAIRPWQHRSWIFPRDPQFEWKAGRVLDLYQGCWQGKTLGGDEYVISADEKTSIQARRRIHAFAGRGSERECRAAQKRHPKATALGRRSAVAHHL